MKKTLIIFLILLSFSHLTEGRGSYPRITFGAEWSYIATYFSGFHYNYFRPDGYRLNEKGSIIGLDSNGEALLHAGYNFNEKWNMSLYTGLTGMTNIHSAIPVTLRVTRFFGDDPLKDRVFAFIDAGSGIGLKKQVQEIFCGKIGGGYRISLSRNTKIDFHLSARCSYTHPQIYFEHEPISMRWTNRNQALLLSVSAGIGLTF